MGSPLALTLLRWLHDATLLALFGALAFAPAVLPIDLRPVMRPALRRIAWISGIAAFLTGMGWFLAETASVAQTSGVAATFNAAPAFVRYLTFGQVLLARLVLVAGAVAMCRWPRVGLWTAGLALALQPWLGHPGEAGVGLAASEILHLVAAGIWVGGLIPLLLCLWVLPAAQVARPFRRFTGIGLAAVVTLAGTGLAQGFVLAGGAGGLAATNYGHVALLKAGLFAAALVLAAWNGLVLTGRLSREPEVGRSLAASIGAEAAIGCGILFAAALLAGLPPGQ